MEKTHVLFRLEKDNSILAVFPYMIADSKKKDMESNV